MTVESLDSLNIAAESLRLPSSVPGWETVQYYLVQQGDRSTALQAGYWDVWAVGRLVSDPVASVTVRQIHIEKEGLSIPGFNAWTDAGGPQAFGPRLLTALREFVTTLARQITSTVIDAGLTTHFSLTTLEAYVACGIPSPLVDRFLFHFEDCDTYRYDSGLPPLAGEACSFLQLSHWTKPLHRNSSTALLAFEAFTEDRLAQIQLAWDRYTQSEAALLDAGAMDGEYIMRLSRGALIELASLLERRLDELPADNVS